ncbi:MAG TPA: 4a-hydroxytetrahydrobiopterin dehydratase [Flavobacteriales bacterium]|nr:pterin-4-alpha-carbinolamine dehydratase [Flavobacteriales bacterium]HRE73910.1 4a-hydroxytetrahydrobiopterin dehydratase [Flavobacteriales bacterium]HRE97104.1 4a-hydroxytetrahydrobiopterin dehydratase [Flavobacteriales bacterium]HRJ38327.1 4a-hydroxytetrahydrobiopterin dehydratase [Flavobacteriales bacterium]
MSSWIEEEGRLVKEYSFSTYPAATAFILQLAFLAEQQSHHPSIYWDYLKVKVLLCTHDHSGSITEMDHRFAASVDALPEKNTQ